MSPAALTSIVRSVPRVRFKNILLATDLGSASGPAQACAILLARMFGAHLFILHVDEGPGLAGQNDKHASARNTGAAARQDLRSLANLFSGAGVAFTFLIEQGEVRETLSRVADEHAIDLIVVGTHARHGLSYLLFGSIAESLGRSSSRPVITVGPKVKVSFEGPLKKIVYATDFSDESKIALPYATSLAQEFRADLTVFHAAPAAERIVRDRQHVETCLLNQIKNLAPASHFPWCKVNYVIAFGETTAEIVRHANSQESDLIILGLHNSVRFTSHLPERLAYRILCEAPCPVLSVLPSTNELKAVQVTSTFLKSAASSN
ncbi:MAG TPA: universal stress protein [Candidatus Angelobacter sp.]|nr:universal stress protein [Candidatus Angelobacter sp.]